MNLDPTRRGPALLVRLPLESLDSDNADDLCAALSRVLVGVERAVLDLEELEFIDSSGLGALLLCLREVTAAGGDLRLCGLSGPVRAVFDLARLHRVFGIHADADEALRSFGG